MQRKSLLALGGTLSRNQRILLGVGGLVLFFALWWLIAEALSDKRPVGDFLVTIPTQAEADSLGINLDSLLRADSIAFANATEYEKVYPLLPRPDQVFQSYPSLLKEDQLVQATTKSIWLNLKGYLWAILISVPIGFAIGLLPIFRGLFSGQVDALRYLPLTALTGMFIIWFGIDDQMKVAFLAFGIIVYLLPVVVQRIDEVKKVYLTAVHTLGATSWQKIRNVYLPAVFEKLIDDIRVLTAISWTYIIIAELLNRTLGVGSLIYIKARQGQIPKVFAILLVIILVGFIQDRLFAYLDRRLFPHKYESGDRAGQKEIELGIYLALGITIGLLIFGSVVDLSGFAATVNWLGVTVGIVMVLWGELKRFQSSAE